MSNEQQKMSLCENFKQKLTVEKERKMLISEIII